MDADSSAVPAAMPVLFPCWEIDACSFPLFPPGGAVLPLRIRCQWCAQRTLRFTLSPQAHRFLDRDFVERVHRHLDVGEFHAATVELHAHLDVVVDHALDGYQDFHECCA